MAAYILSCESVADLTKEHFAEKDIHWVPFHFAVECCLTDVLVVA